MNSRKHAQAGLALALAFVWSVGPAQAATLTWDANAATALQTDGAGTWTTASQWWDGAANVTWNSGTPDSASFGNGGAGGTIALGSSITAGSLTFNRFSGTYTLGTSGDLTLNSGLTMNANAGAVTISRQVTLGGAQSWINNAGTTLTVSGNIVNGGNLLTIGGNSPVGLAGPTVASGITISSAIGGAGGLTKNGFPVLTLTGDNGYSGTTTVNGGTLRLSGASGAINSTGAIALNGGNLYLLNTAQVNRLADGAAITSTGGTITYNNTSGANVYTETIGAVTLSSGQLNVVEAVNQAGAGSQTLTLSGLTPSGSAAATFSSAGTRTTKNMIVVSGASATPANQIIGPWATIGTAAAAQTDFAIYNGSAQIVDAAIAGSDESTWTVGAQAFTQSTTPQTLGGTRTMTGLRNTAATATTAMNGNYLETYGLLNGVSTLWTISGTGGLRTPAGGGNLFVTTGSGAITISGPITDSSDSQPVTLVKSGTGGTLTLSGSNGYTGGTVLNAGTLAANTTAALPGYNSAGKVVFNGGTLQLPSAWAMADINTLVANATMNSGALALDTTSGTQTQTAAWNLGALGLTKVGTGTLVLNQANTYSGPTTVSTGTLQLSQANALGSSELTLAGAATVSLDTTVNLTTLSVTAQGGTVTGGTLAFGAGGSIVNKVDAGYGDTQPVMTISSAITGSPSVWAAAGTGSGPLFNYMKFAPTNGSQTLGKVSLGYADGNGGDKGWIWLSGTTTGNSVGEIVDLGPYSYLKQDSGTWTYGNVPVSTMYMLGGNMILNGTVRTSYQGVNLSGGTLHYNVPGAIDTSSKTFTITGGNLDNTSGAALTATNNPTTTWGGNWTFLGSNGTNSDLYIGTGAVTLSATRQVTVSNAVATLTVGGVISGTGFGLTKAGAGTLKLTGKNTYSGATTISNGTLQVVVGGSCSNSAVTVATSAGTLAISVTNTVPKWTCSNLTLDSGNLKFSFSVAPSFTDAPLSITNTVAFTGSPTIVVDSANLAAGKKYPLLTVGGTPPVNVPAVSITGMSGILGWEGNTLYLNIPPAGSIVLFW